MLNLKSGFSKDYKGYFVLDEDAMRRIVGVLEAKAKHLPYPCTVVFHVRREDDRFYETTKIEDVLNDANTINRRINILGIELRNSDENRNPEPWDRDRIATVAFDRTLSRQVQVNVASDDRSWALLLTDESEPQVVRTLTAKSVPTWLLLLLFLAIGGFLDTLMAKIPWPAIVPSFVVTALNMAIWFGVFVASVSTVGRRDDWVARWAGPEAVFLWGDQVNLYRNREEQRRNFFWVVIVGFVVSVAATISTNVMVPTPQSGASEKAPKKIDSGKASSN